jgi:5'-nucleotidase
MTRLRFVFALLAAALLLAPGALAANGPKQKDNDTYVQLLAINDFHGNLEPNTPGNTTYCCEFDTNPAVNKDVPVTRPTGGAAFLAAKIKSLRERNSNTITVGAGDLIGASPLISGLFHDEPSIEALNAMQLDVTGIGNHEFDEGLNEIYRIQNGGCTSDPTTCALGPFGGSLFKYLAANVFFQGTNDTILPPYEIRKVGNAKIAFIGLTLEGTPLVVTPSSIQGLEFRPEVPVVNALVQKLRAEEGVRTFVVLIHQGGIQGAPFSNAGKYGAPFANGFADVNACDNLAGDIKPIIQQLDPQVDVVVSAHTHQPYNCPNYAGTGILLTSASSFGRLVTSIDLTIDHQTKDVTAKSATNYVVKQTEGPWDSTPVPIPGSNPPATRPTSLGTPTAQDATVAAIVAKWKAKSAPLANQVIGHITSDLLGARDGGAAGSNAAGEQPIGEVIADGQLAATSPSDFGGAQMAFMNPGGIRASFRYQPGQGETRQPGEVTYAMAFAVQPFANTMQVKTMTGYMLYRLLEQQWAGSNAGTNKKILQISNGLSYAYTTQVDPVTLRDVNQHVVPGSVKLGTHVILPTETFQVAMNNFLADGGDGFSVFKEGTTPIGGMVDLDAFVNWLKLPANNPVPTPPMNRITRVVVP